VGDVGAISDAATFSALHRQLTAASMRQTVAAGNLANLDTPGFRAREVDFDKVLDGTLSAGGRLATTNARHLAGVAGSDPAIVEASDAAARRDGNTVQLDRELLTMSRAASDFAAAQTALAAKFRMVKYAINEAK
jgi:flagellar basal-body rod protein FlgB